MTKFMIFLQDWNICIDVMPELPDELDSVRSTVSTVTGRLVGVLSTLLTVALVAAWSLFWLNVATIHYSQGDLVSAVFTATLLPVPAVLGLLWYLGVSLDTDMVSPSVDVDVIGS